MSFLRNYKLWLILAAIAVVFYWLLICVSDAYYLGHSVFVNFKGNLLSGLITSVIFFLIALWLSKSMEDNVEAIKEIEIERQRMKDEEWNIKRFVTFLKNESHHNVRLKDVGLEFEIRPIRDNHKEPVRYDSEDDDIYLVKMVGPAHANILEKKDWDEYHKSGIRTNEFYYCKFFNGTWNLGQSIASAVGCILTWTTRAQKLTRNLPRLTNLVSTKSGEDHFPGFSSFGKPLRRVSASNLRAENAVFFAKNLTLAAPLWHKGAHSGWSLKSSQSWRNPSRPQL